MSTQSARSEGTRAKLAAAARALFAERGYSDVATEEIVARAEVTRGALYHHFADKRDLMRAVYEQVEEEVVAALGGAIERAGAEDPIEAIRIAIVAFFDLALEGERARIALIEAPVALGWDEWREIDMRYGLGLTIAALEAAMDAGRMARMPLRPLAQMLVAALGEAGIMIATSDDPAAARAEVEPSLIAMIDGLAICPPS
ncbi:TetR/AcrR family transcriptional regulator [soil metagenome]